MKNILRKLLSLTIICSLVITLATPFTVSASATREVRVSDATQLRDAMRDGSPGRTILLSRDIALNAWDPLDVTNANFVLDGNGHVLTISANRAPYAGLIGRSNNSNITFQNLSLSGTITSSGNQHIYAGSLIGLVNGGIIVVDGVDFEGTINAQRNRSRNSNNAHAGGLFGEIRNGATVSVIDSVLNAHVEARSLADGGWNNPSAYAAGIAGKVVGSNTNLTITRTFTFGTIRVDAHTSNWFSDASRFGGGLVGHGHANVFDSFRSNTVSFAGNGSQRQNTLGSAVSETEVQIALEAVITSDPEVQSVFEDVVDGTFDVLKYLKRLRQLKHVKPYITVASQIWSNRELIGWIIGELVAEIREPGRLERIHREGSTSMAAVSPDFILRTALDAALHGNNMGSEVWQNTAFFAGDFIQSSNGAFIAIMLQDGQFAIFNATQMLWSTGTFTSYHTARRHGNIIVSHFIFQSDGNLVVYSTCNRAMWSPNIHGRGTTRLVMENNGNLAAYDNNGWVVWSSGTIGARNEGVIPTASTIAQNVQPHQASSHEPAWNNDVFVDDSWSEHIWQPPVIPPPVWEDVFVDPSWPSPPQATPAQTASITIQNQGGGGTLSIFPNGVTNSANVWTTVEVAVGSTISLVATPNGNTTFSGWVDMDNHQSWDVISYSSSWTFTVYRDMHLVPWFRWH